MRPAFLFLFDGATGFFVRDDEWNHQFTWYAGVRRAISNLANRNNTMPPDGTFAIGIDVGGSRTRAALVGHDGRVWKRRAAPTQSWLGEGASHVELSPLLQSIDELRRTVAAKPDADVPIGLALPGVLDRAGRIVARSVNLAALEGLPLGDTIQQHTRSRVTVMTDIDAATWGEYLAMDIRPDRFVHLRIGTGIGCGAVVDGCIVRLARSVAGHVDALIVDKDADATVCGCGRRGCLEVYASGRALSRVSDSCGLGEGLDGWQRAIENRESAAMQAMEGPAKWLAAAIDNLVSQFESPVVCIGGGVAAHLPALIDAATRPRESAGGAEVARRPVAVQASLGDDAGVIGAALLALRENPPS